uniref:Terpene cyclase ptmB n=1 Tax=Penicillium ochrochloron TaxID=69780 RepID=PTMB_PENOH|nr:RecName: Full=Terpene cyclase ptmB; AltName: Full=Penitrem biosynthesis cluster 1 protein B [Penicillium simplicissimum]BAU61559.1 putative membrane protein [Penicillium simplicissimum]
MDGFDVSQAPPEYRSVEPIANLFVLGMGLGWLINYVGMIYQSFKDETYGMAIMPLCCNIAWEIVYSLIYPSKSLTEQGVFIAGLTINIGVMYAAIKFAPKEWSHAPLVMRNLSLIFFLATLGFLTGHLALAAEIGHSLAYSWGAVVCQLLLSVGGLCQLLCRGCTRGASYTLWLSRFLGSSCTVGFASLRWMYWPESFSWLNSPLVLWSLALFLTVDGSYGICYWYVRQYELSLKEAEGRKSK